MADVALALHCVRRAVQPAGRIPRLLRPRHRRWCVASRRVRRDHCRSQRPLADAAVRALGPPGASLVALGAVLSIAGTLNSITFATSRLLLGMSEQGQLPAVFGRIHAGYRTPVAAILITAGVAL